MGIKPFLKDYEFQVKFRVVANQFRAIENRSNTTYNPARPFDFESKVGQVLFYDKLPRDYFTNPSERYDNLKNETIRKNILQYLYQIANPTDITDPSFKLEILENEVNAIRG